MDRKTVTIMSSKPLTLPTRPLTKARGQDSPSSVLRGFDEFDKRSKKSPIPVRRTFKPVVSRSVHWASQCEVFEIIHINDMEDEEVFSCWYHEEDYSMIKKRIRVSVLLMEAGRAVESPEHTDRGIECRTADGARERYRNRRKTVNAVLDEQDSQWDNNVKDDDRLAKVSMGHSGKSRVSAMVRARQDQEFVRAHLRALRRERLQQAIQKSPIDLSPKDTEKECVDRPPLLPISQKYVHV